MDGDVEAQDDHNMSPASACEVVMPLSINIRADNYGLSMLICGNRLHNKTRVTITDLYTKLLAAAIQIQEYGRGANKNRIETHK